MTLFEKLYNAVMTGAKRKQSPKDVIAQITPSLMEADVARTMWDDNHHWGTIGITAGGITSIIVLMGKDTCTQVQIAHGKVVRSGELDITQDVDSAAAMYLAFAA